MDVHSSGCSVASSACRTSRRRLLGATGGGVLAMTAAAGMGRFSAAAAPQDATPVGTPASQSLPVTGKAVPELAGFDRAITTMTAKWHLPGGQLALAKDGRLVLNRGYGFADRERGEPVQPTSLFRIASVSKPITAVAILALVDVGQLSLDDKVFPLLALAPPTNAPIGPRLDRITVRDLLIHAGGWDSEELRPAVPALEPDGRSHARTGRSP